MQRFFISSYLR